MRIKCFYFIKLPFFPPELRVCFAKISKILISEKFSRFAEDSIFSRERFHPSKRYF